MSDLGSAADRLSNQHAQIRRSRLLFRCWHRGTQESDLILGRFAEAHVADLNSAQLERFEVLLDCADPDLFDWIVGGSTPPKEYDHDVMCLLRAFCARRDKPANGQLPRTARTTQE
jgi:antitoxin CptB